MAKDEKWRNRAPGYKRFVPDRGRTKLSEWYYCSMSCFIRSSDLASPKIFKMMAKNDKKVSQGLGRIAARTVQKVWQEEGSY